MDTLGWILVLVALLLARSVYKGRVLNLGQDLSDAFLALINRDGKALGDVLGRSGDAASPAIAMIPEGSVGAAAAAAGASVIGNALLAKAESLGKAAKGYRWTATGPDYYDCSGLVWRACKDIGVYTGPRFTTFDIGTRKGFMRVFDTPQIGDIVVWPTHHMGIVSGPDKFYSAKDTKLGIGYARISTWMKSAPVYYRISGRAEVPSNAN